jgi:hypothetical protein
MMDFNLVSQTYGAIRFKSVVPASLAKLTMPGSQPHSAEGVFGTILLQQINAGTARLVYAICKIRKDLALDFNIPGPVWLTHIALKNENRFDIAGANPVYLKQGQFNMIRSSSISGTYYMERGNEYRSISIYYPGEQLQELLPFFPFLNRFNKEPDSGKRIFLFRNHHWMDSQLMDISGHLLHCTYRGSLRQLYFEYKIKELLLLLLNRENPGATIPKGLNDRTIELINEAKYIIEAGFGKPITLHKIARQLGMSEVKLQNGFRQLFGQE